MPNAVKIVSSRGLDARYPPTPHQPPSLSNPQTLSSLLALVSPRSRSRSRSLSPRRRHPTPLPPLRSAVSGQIPPSQARSSTVQHLWPATVTTGTGSSSLSRILRSPPPAAIRQWATAAISRAPAPAISRDPAPTNLPGSTSMHSTSTRRPKNGPKWRPINRSWSKTGRLETAPFERVFLPFAPAPAEVAAAGHSASALLAVGVEAAP